jgi:hypothetical protein
MHSQKLEFLVFPSIKKKCLTVTVKPEVINTKVLIKGTPKKSKNSTPTGGQESPNSILGVKR